MTHSRLVDELHDELQAIPLIDAHTHLIDGRLSAQGLHDVILYHMAVSDLYAAGCPDGARLTEYPERPDKEEITRRISRALPYLRYCVNTSTAWAIRTILEDLYDWRDPIDSHNWRKLDELIRQRSQQPHWGRELLRRAGIERSCTEIARRQDGSDDDLFVYSLEWAFFTRCQWGEYDTALLELERCWGMSPGSPTPVGTGKTGRPDARVKSLEDVHEAVQYYVNAMPLDRIVSTATHISTDIELRLIDPPEMRLAMERRDNAGVRERDIYASYIHELFLTELERRLEEVESSLVFQFSYGAEPLPYETGSRLTQRSIAHIAQMIFRHPGIHFQVFLASRHGNHSICTLARELPNLSLSGYWWHTFFPSTMRQIIDERLDMLPLNRQVGFFSDAYCAEWAYAKAVLFRKQFAEALATHVEKGQYSRELALQIARAVLYETPSAMYNLQE